MLGGIAKKFCSFRVILTIGEFLSRKKINNSFKHSSVLLIPALIPI